MLQNISRKIVFHDCNVWCLEIAGKTCNLIDFQIQNTFEFTQMSVNLVCNIVKGLKLCTGLPQNKEMTLINNGYIIREKWTDRKSNTYDIHRSIQCSRILKLTQSSSVCIKCRKLVMHHAKNTQDNKENIYEENGVELSEDDNDDFNQILQDIIPHANKELLDLITSQKENLERNPKQRRWDKEVIRLCLSIWIRSKKAYDQIKKSGFLVLPSGRLLHYYQNEVKQGPGFNKEVFEWMKLEADRRDISPENRERGILFDEMAIQEDLVIHVEKGKGVNRIVGFVDTGPTGENMRILLQKKMKRLLQHMYYNFYFLGLMALGSQLPISQQHK